MNPLTRSGSLANAFAVCHTNNRQRANRLTPESAANLTDWERSCTATGSGPSVPRASTALAFTIVKNTGGIREKGRLAFIGFTPFGACQQASETGFGPIRVRNIIRYEYCHKKEDRRIAILMLRTGRYDTVVTVGMQRYNKLMRFQPANARPSLFGSD